MFARTYLATATFVLVASLLTGAGTILVNTSPIHFNLSTQDYIDEQRQIQCLAKNVYYESANQPIDGMLGVAYVTINRSMSGDWPKDLCEVVYQKTQSVCQFSWVCEKVGEPYKKYWEQSYAVAKHVWYKYNPEADPTFGAKYFHATYVRPGWKREKTVQLGDHIFYK